MSTLQINMGQNHYTHAIACHLHPCSPRPRSSDALIKGNKMRFTKKKREGQKVITQQQSLNQIGE
jgi:hypothetical protein